MLISQSSRTESLQRVLIQDPEDLAEKFNTILPNFVADNLFDETVWLFGFLIHMYKVTKARPGDKVVFEEKELKGQLDKW